MIRVGRRERALRIAAKRATSTCGLLVAALVRGSV